jgi:hypothetical protein
MQTAVCTALCGALFDSRKAKRFHGNLARGPCSRSRGASPPSELQFVRPGWLAAFVLQAYRLEVVEEMAMSGDKNFDRPTLEHALAELGQAAPSSRPPRTCSAKSQDR